MRSPRRLRRLAAAFPLLVGGVACGGDGGSAELGCGRGEPVEERPLRVAATVAPITNLVSVVAADTGHEVVGIVPEGRNSHTYEPSPSLAAVLEEADVLFMNGLALEQPTRELALANMDHGSEICELGTTILPASEYLFDVSFPEEAGDPNPHLWTNPPMAAEYVELIAETLSARFPADADRFRQNATTFGSAVAELDAAVRTATATVPDDERRLLTYHDAYAYFAEEYGWEVVGAVQPSTFDEPTPREVAELIDQVRTLGVTAIFGSEVFPSPVLEQVAAETGARYVDDLRDDDLPGSPGDPEHSWFALMQFNYVTLVEAFGGDASAIRDLPVPAFEDAATYPQ